MMENQTEEIKRKVDIVSLINEYVPLKKTGRNYKALCPFHAEKTPSFVVSPDRQIFKCFGCNEGGDIFAFVIRADGIEFGETIKKLADRAGVRLKDYRPSGAEKKKEMIYTLNQTASDLYNYLLTKHKVGRAALDYLHSRKINDSSIKNFQLGFAPEKGDPAVRFLLKKGFSPENLTSAGLSSTRDLEEVFDRFKGRIIFPIKNTQGKITAFSGRALGNREPKYLNSPETLIFNKSNSLYGIDIAKAEMRKQKTAVLVEGNLDVISSHQAGVANVVAPLGTALTEKQLDILSRFVENLLIGFDTDIAGDAAAKRGIELAEGLGFSVKVINLKDGKDPDDIIRKNPTIWKKNIRESISIYDFILGSALKRWDLNQADGKKHISREVLPYIAKLTDEITKDHYVQKTAVSLKVSEEAVRTELKKYLPSSRKDDTASGDQEETSASVRSDKINLLERYLLALILQTGILPKTISQDLFNQEESASLFQIIKKHAKSEGRIKLKKLSQEIPEYLSKIYDDEILYGLGENILEYSEVAEKEISSCAARIKELNLRSRLRKIGLEIKQAEAVSKESVIKSLTEQFRDLSLELSQLKSND